MKYALTLCLVMALSCFCLAQQTIVNDKQLAHQRLIASLDGLPAQIKAPDSESHKAYVNILLQVAYNVIPAFRALAGTNENEAFYLAGTFQRQEIKAAAIFGAATGIRPPANAVINANPKPTPAKQQPQN